MKGPVDLSSDERAERTSGPPLAAKRPVDDLRCERAERDDVRMGRAPDAQALKGAGDGACGVYSVCDGDWGAGGVLGRRPTLPGIYPDLVPIHHHIN